MDGSEIMVTGQASRIEIIAGDKSERGAEKRKEKKAELAELVVIAADMMTTEMEARTELMASSGIETSEVRPGQPLDPRKRNTFRGPARQRDKRRRLDTRWMASQTGHFRFGVRIDRAITLLPRSFGLLCSIRLLLFTLANVSVGRRTIKSLALISRPLGERAGWYGVHKPEALIQWVVRSK